MLILLFTEISPARVEAFGCLKPDGISCLDQPWRFGSHGNPEVPPTATSLFFKPLPLPPPRQGPWRRMPLSNKCKHFTVPTTLQRSLPCTLSLASGRCGPWSLRSTDGKNEASGTRQAAPSPQWCQQDPKPCYDCGPRVGSTTPG